MWSDIKHRERQAKNNMPPSLNPRNKIKFQGQMLKLSMKFEGQMLKLSMKSTESFPSLSKYKHLLGNHQTPSNCTKHHRIWQSILSKLRK